MKRGTKSKSKTVTRLTIDFDNAVLARVAQYVERIAEVVPGANRTDAIRALVERALRDAGL